MKWQDGGKLYGKQILNDPEKYFTEELLTKLDEVPDQEFSYGKGIEETGEEEEETEQYETQVNFIQGTTMVETSMISRPLVDQMNEIIDDLYENRFDELYIQNSYREVEGGTQIAVIKNYFQKEINDYILTMARGYLVHSQLHFMEVDYSEINLEIDKIWTTDSRENDYIH